MIEYRKRPQRRERNGFVYRLYVSTDGRFAVECSSWIANKRLPKDRRVAEVWRALERFGDGWVILPNVRNGKRIHYTRNAAERTCARAARAAGGQGTPTPASMTDRRSTTKAGV